MRNWEHLSDIELDVYVGFYTDYLNYLVQKRLRQPDGGIGDKIEYVQARLAGMEAELQIRLKK